MIIILLLLLVSPALGDSLKDLRSIHSGFMTSLQQTAAEFVNEIHELQDNITKNNEYIAHLESDIAKLQDTMGKLDEVRNHIT